jgi:hypothetical protein
MKKKKRGGNSKIFSTIILVFVVCCLMSTSLWAAKKIDFHSASQPPIADFSDSETKTDYSNADKTDSCDYCDPWGDPYYLYITRVKLADLDNPSGPIGFSLKLKFLWR